MLDLPRHFASACRLRADVPKAPPPARLQDLPPELLLDCGDFLGLADRAVFFAPHPDLRTESRDAGTMATVRGATGPRALKKALAAAPDAPKVLVEVVHRACALLRDLRIEARKRVWLEDSPPVAVRKQAADRAAALEQVLCDCLDAALALDGARGRRVLCALAARVSHPFSALEACRPGLQARFSARLVDGLLDVAETGSRDAAGALRRSLESSVSVLALAGGSPQENLRRLARLVGLRAIDPGPAQRLRPGKIEREMPDVLRLLDAWDAGLTAAPCARTLALVDHLADPKRICLLLEAVVRCACRTGAAEDAADGGNGGLLKVGAVLAEVGQRMERLPDADRQSMHTLMIDHFTQAFG